MKVLYSFMKNLQSFSLSEPYREVRFFAGDVIHYMIGMFEMEAGGITAVHKIKRRVPQEEY